MADVIWTSPAVDWVDDVEVSPAEGEAQLPAGGQVKVTTLHWRATLTDGEFTASSYGTTGDDGNRVYTLAALEAVPESVVLKWIADALGAEEVKRIEEGLNASIAEQKTPTSGTVNPS